MDGMKGLPEKASLMAMKILTEFL
ncbi:MAG: hypothetical protein RLZ75_2457, partial [Pseudomonadota bacterium]